MPRGYEMCPECNGEKSVDGVMCASCRGSGLASSSRTRRSVIQTRGVWPFLIPFLVMAFPIGLVVGVALMVNSADLTCGFSETCDESWGILFLIGLVLAMASLLGLVALLIRLRNP